MNHHNKSRSDTRYDEAWQVARLSCEYTRNMMKMLTRTKNVRWPCGPAMDCTRPSTTTTSPSYHPFPSKGSCSDNTLLEGAEQSVAPVAHEPRTSICQASRAMAAANGFMTDQLTNQTDSSQVHLTIGREGCCGALRDCCCLRSITSCLCGVAMAGTE